MADADLDAVIRRLAKQQSKALTAVVKARRNHYVALAAKAKTADARHRLKQLAKDAVEYGMAAVKRLQVSSDNAADSYARGMRKAADGAAAPASDMPVETARTKKA